MRSSGRRRRTRRSARSTEPSRAASSPARRRRQPSRSTSSPTTACSSGASRPTRSRRSRSQRRPRRPAPASVVIVHVDDAYGRPYADAVADALGDDIAVETIAIPVDDDDLDRRTRHPRRDRTAGRRLGRERRGHGTLPRGDRAARRSQRSRASSSTTLPRSAASRPVIAGLPSTIRNRVVVIAPQIVLRDGALTAQDAPFGPQVTDCVNLLALSAIQGDSDSPEVIAGQMSSVSDGGAQCAAISRPCALRLADDQEIDYDGPTGHHRPRSRRRSIARLLRSVPVRTRRFGHLRSRIAVAGS